MKRMYTLQSLAKFIFIKLLRLVEIDKHVFVVEPYDGYIILWKLSYREHLLDGTWSGNYNLCKLHVIQSIIMSIY